MIMIASVMHMLALQNLSVPCGRLAYSGCEADIVFFSYGFCLSSFFPLFFLPLFSGVGDWMPIRFPHMM